MSFGLDMALLANGYKGYQQGADEELARQHLAAKNAMEKEKWAQDKEEFALKKEANQRARDIQRGITEAQDAGSITEEPGEAPAAPADPRVTPAAPENAIQTVPTKPGPMQDPAQTQQAAPAPIAPAPASASALPVQPAAPVAPSSRFKVGGIYYKSRDEAQAAGQDAVNAATIKAMRKGGNITGAMDFENSIRAAKLHDIQFKQAQRAEIDDAFNRGFDKRIEEHGGDTGSAIASMLTETNVNGLNGIKAESVKLPDGRTTIRKITKDGKVSEETFPAGPAGEEQMRQRFLRADPATKTAWVKERKAEALALENRTWDRGMEEKKLKVHQDQVAAQLKNAESQLAISGGHLRLQQAEEKRKSTLFAQESSVPHSVKMEYAALESGAKLKDAAISKAQADGSWNPENDGTRQLIKDRADLALQMSDLLKPWIEKAEKSVGKPAAQADPAGIRTPAPEKR